MKEHQIIAVVKQAARMEPVKARRIVTALVAKAGDADPQAKIRAALAEDLQPLGDALWGAYQAGDAPAMQAAMRKISERMPDFLASENLEEALAADLLAALTENDESPEPNEP